MIHYCRNCTGLFDHDPVRYDIKCPFCRKTTITWTRRQIALEEATLLMAKLAEKAAKRKKGKKKITETIPDIPPSPEDNEREEIPAVRPATKAEAKIAKSEYYEPPEVEWEEDYSVSDWEEESSFNRDWDDEESFRNEMPQKRIGFLVDEDGLPIGGADENGDYSEEGGFMTDEYHRFLNDDDYHFPSEESHGFAKDDECRFIDDEIFAQNDDDNYINFVEYDNGRFWDGSDGDFIDDVPARDVDDDSPYQDVIFCGDYDSQIPYSGKRQEKAEIKPWRKRPPTTGKKKKKSA